MKRLTLWAVLTAVMLVAGVTFISCSREKAENKKMPPGHEQMVEQYLKGMEEARKTVVARVNGADITMYDLSGRMKQILSNYARSGQQVTPEVEQKARKDALAALIFRDLAVQEAMRRKMTVPKEKVDAIIQQVKTKMGSEDAYKEYLKREDMTETSLRKQIEKDQLFGMIVAAEIFNKVKVNEKQVREIYTKEKKNFVMPEVFGIVDVVFPKGRGDEVAMKKAKEILSLLKKNNYAFSKLPKDKTFMVRDGFVDKEEYPTLFAALTKMKKGEVSDIITEADGLHIVKMQKKEPSREMTFGEARGAIEEKLRTSLAEKRKEEWEADLKKGSKIEVLLTEVAKK
jgi:parvulin-like peptidyl-prolyl isomerase